MTRRIVVVGNGMAGARVVDDLLRRDSSLAITVLGEEEQPAYNRILLSDVLAGKRRHSDIVLRSAAGPVRHLGVRVERIDRGAQTVHGSDGCAFAYDALVLATGSTAVVPPVHGIAGPSGKLLPGVHVFRTVEDCAAIAREARRATRAVVVGGGLLGLEAARGLLEHGLSVDVVHGPDRLMDLQLDAVGGAVLRRAVEALGVGVHLGSFASAVLGTRCVTGIGLADGRTVDGDLVVLACGVRPQVALARDAGLEVDRGILVDDELRTSDPHVHAIGECAQHRGTVYGLVAPAWDQAAVVAEVATGGTASYTGSRTTTRLKAMGLEVAAMGDTAPDLGDGEDGLEVLQWADPARHVYKKLVVRDGVVTGAILLATARRRCRPTACTCSSPASARPGRPTPGTSTTALSSAPATPSPRALCGPAPRVAAAPSPTLPTRPARRPGAAPAARSWPPCWPLASPCPTLPPSPSR
jgi:NAD(P)H-nitrite reductase large subunit